MDASYTGSDFTAYTIFKELDDGRIIGFGMLRQNHVDDCITDIKMYHERYRAGIIALETNADKGYLGGELEDNGFYTYEYHESMNKYVKISTYLKKHWKDIYWLAGTDTDYINMICDYNEHAEQCAAQRHKKMGAEARLLRSILALKTYRSAKNKSEREPHYQINIRSLHNRPSFCFYNQIVV